MALIIGYFPMRVPNLKIVMSDFASASRVFARSAQIYFLDSGFSKRAWRVTSPIAKGASMHNEPDTLRLSASEQWSRITTVLVTAIAGAEEAQRLQKAATQQLDLAQYAISTLTDELAAVMAIPGRRERASVHQFESVLVRAGDRSIAA
jgi:hypothetical protein